MTIYYSYWKTVQMGGGICLSLPCSIFSPRGSNKGGKRENGPCSNGCSCFQRLVPSEWQCTCHLAYPSVPSEFPQGFHAQLQLQCQNTDSAPVKLRATLWNRGTAPSFCLPWLTLGDQLAALDASVTLLSLQMQHCKQNKFLSQFLANRDV